MISFPRMIVAKHYLVKMKKILLWLVMLVLLATTVSAVDHYYNITLNYNKGVISYSAITVSPAQENLEPSPGLYIAEVISVEDEILNLTFFDFPLEMIVDYLDGGGELIILDEATINLYVPYYEDAKAINIYDEELNKKLTLDVSMYSKIISTSPTPIVTEQTVQQRLAEENKKTLIINIVLSAAIVAIVIIILILLTKRKK